MIKIVVGILLILHGFVHLLYLGQSARFFTLQPGMVWPDSSWALAKLLGVRMTRFLGNSACVVAAGAFVAGGVGVFLSQSWWLSVVVGSACGSSLLYILLWNGRLDRLADQGGIGLLINAAILISLLEFGWPKMGL